MATRSIRDVIKKDEDRLFRVDRGCYIIYTGNTPSDRRPFVRMGNSGWLPSELKSLIGNVIVTNLLPYDPVLELSGFGNGSSRKRYIGEGNPLNHVLGFLESSKVDSKSIVRVLVEDGTGLDKINGNDLQDGRSYALFYKDGNIVITYGNSRIFELLKEVGVDLRGISKERSIRRVRTDRQRLEGLLSLLHQMRERGANSLQTGRLPTVRSSSQGLADSRSLAKTVGPAVASSEAVVAILNVPEVDQSLEEPDAQPSPMFPKGRAGLGVMRWVRIPRRVWIATGAGAGAIALILLGFFVISSIREGMRNTPSQQISINRTNEAFQPPIKMEEIGTTTASSSGDSPQEIRVGPQEEDLFPSIPPISLEGDKITEEAIVSRPRSENSELVDRGFLPGRSEGVDSPSKGDLNTVNDLPDSGGPKSGRTESGRTDSRDDKISDNKAIVAADLADTSQVSEEEEIAPSIGIAKVIKPNSVGAEGKEVLIPQETDPKPTSSDGSESAKLTDKLTEIVSSPSDRSRLQDQSSVFPAESDSLEVVGSVSVEGGQESRLPENVIVLKGDEEGSFRRRFTTYEVLEYVNKIASLNGYHEVGLRDEGLRNPDLIYPGEELVMPSGDKIVVVNEGDTIWKIARNDLENLF